MKATPTDRRARRTAAAIFLALVVIYNANGREIGTVDSQPAKFTARELAMLGTLLLLRVIVRNEWLSVVLWVLCVAMLNLADGAMPLQPVFAIAIAAFAVTVLLRFGLLSTAVMLFFTDLMTRLPVTLDSRAWYLQLSMLTLFLIAALAVYGFVAALAGRSAFGEDIPAAAAD